MPARQTPLRLAAAAMLLALVASGCGGVESLTTREALERLSVASTKLYDVKGALVANLHGEVNRDIAELHDIPKRVQDAAIAIEDQRFWKHAGIDLRSISRALIANVRSAQTVQGGSTISQQLVKNLYFPDAERTIARKVAEARYTIDFERRYSKQRILEMYLNTIYLGRGAYGFEAAAKAWFGKQLQDVTLGESAFLAGLIHEPGLYDPSEAPNAEARERVLQRGKDRRAVVLRRMVGQGLVARADGDAAATEPLEIAPREPNRWDHPYFVDYVLRTLGVLGVKARSELDPRFDVLGKTPEERARAVYQGGLRIHTTVDPRIQQAAEDAVRDVLPAKPDRLSAAVVVVAPDSGEVRALVGGRDYYPEGCSSDVPEDAQPRACRLAKVNLALGNRGGGSGRQPGSGFKPVVLASALDHGLTLGDRFSSSPFTLPLPAGEWKVRNYEGSGGGRMTVLDGTVHSVNALYARLEVDGLGQGDAISGSRKVADMARKLGVPFPTPDDVREDCGEEFNETGRCTPADVVPAIALGAKEVAPLDLASAYATIANDGVRVPPTVVTKITDRTGKTLYEAKPASERILSSNVARTVTHALRQVVERGTATRARLRDRPAAGKTGTSQQWRDAWFNGYVPQLAATVWVGNPIPVRRSDGSWEVESMTPRSGYAQRVVGGSYPAIIWNRLMTRALEDVEPKDFPDPSSELLTPSRRSQDDSTDEREESRREHEEDIPPPAGFAIRARSSSGGGTASVPGVVGMSYASARNAVARAGLSAAGVKQCGGGGGGLSVWRQSPGAGASVPRGSTVTLWYSGAVC